MITLKYLMPEGTVTRQILYVKWGQNLQKQITLFLLYPSLRHLKGSKTLSISSLCSAVNCSIQVEFETPKY